MLSLYRFLVRGGTQSQIKHGEFGEDSKAAEVIKHEERGRKKEYFVLYKGWPNTYDEWKTVNEMKHL